MITRPCLIYHNINFISSLISSLTHFVSILNVGWKMSEKYGKFYVQLIKCTRGHNSNFTDLVEKYYVIKTYVAFE